MTSGNAHPKVDELSHADLLLQMAAINEADRFEAEERNVRRDSTTGRIVASQDYGADDQLNVAFSTEPVFSKLETVLARNRGDNTPKYIDMDFITISAPGQAKDLLIHAQVTDFYQWRFPKEYAAFKAGQTSALIGTPLMLWPLITPSQLKEFEFHGIRSIEQVANLADSQASSFRGLYALKDKAKAFLANAADSAAAGRLQAELAERDEALNSMKAQMAEMAAMLKSLQPSAKAEPKAPKA